MYFEAGETERTVEVPICHTPEWNPTLEFSMHLSRAHGASLGLNLHQCRVWIIDNDTFPSSRCTEESSRLTLLIEYFRHAACSPVVFEGSLKTLVIDQLPNLLFVVQLVLQVQLVDKVGGRIVVADPPQSHAGPRATRQPATRYVDHPCVDGRSGMKNGRR